MEELEQIGETYYFVEMYSFTVSIKIENRKHFVFTCNLSFSFFFNSKLDSHMINKKLKLNNSSYTMFHDEVRTISMSLTLSANY